MYILNSLIDTEIPVGVTVEVYLYKILDLDERNQMLHSSLWLRYNY